MPNNLELEPFLYEKELYDTKNLLNYKFSKRNVTTNLHLVNTNIISVFKIENNGDCFNDLLFIVKLNSSEKIQLSKLINFVEFMIGGAPYDRIPGEFFDILLRHYKVNAVQTNDTIIIPIPIAMIMKNSCVFLNKSHYHYSQIKVCFKIPINDVQYSM